MSYTALPIFTPNSIGYSYVYQNPYTIIPITNLPITTLFTFHSIPPGIYLFNASIQYATTPSSPIPTVWSTTLSDTVYGSNTPYFYSSVNGVPSVIGGVTYYYATASISYLLNVSATTTYYLLGYSPTSTTTHVTYMQTSLTRIA
jgi:hypothetical protein